jgi:hypothetical protein
MSGAIKITAISNEGQKVMRRVWLEAGKKDKMVKRLGFRENILSHNPFTVLVEAKRGVSKLYKPSYMEALVDKQLRKAGLKPVFDYLVEVIQ